MKDSKKQKGTKVKLTKGKRVSIRCPLAIDRTDLEYNYDAGCAQICLTVENMGGGGVTNDSVESAIVVIRLYDAQGALVPCTKNEYFAKLLRFGDEGLQSGSQITFRLTPDCDSGLRVADLELYISRVRYADGSVTDYLRGDFFDLPGDAISLQKKHKKDLPDITAKFGTSAKFLPEELTDIIWRCACGEFCESEQCATCGASKAALFDYFRPAAPKVAAAMPKAAIDPTAPLRTPEPTSAADQTTVIDRAAADPAGAPATDATTEYDTGTFVPNALGTVSDSNAESGFDRPANGEQGTDAEDTPHEFRAPAPQKKPDKLKTGLIAAIIASGALLLIIVVLLIVAMVSRSNTPAESTVETTTTAPITTDPPITPEDPIPEYEKIVRAYLEQNAFDNALGYARMSDCSDALINEVLTAAIDYYTNVAPDAAKALQYAEELGDTATIETLTLQQYNDAMSKGDYTAAITYAQKLTTDKDAKLTAAAEALVQRHLAANDFDAALQAIKTYPTLTKAEDVQLAAITYHVGIKEFDEALAIADVINNDAQKVSIAKAAIDYYVGQQNYDRAADYLQLTGDSADILALLPHFTEPAIKKHLPTFFAYLSFSEKQAVHASVMSASTSAGIIDVYGNAFWGIDQSHIAFETGKTVVSIKCSEQTTVLLFSDGTVAAYGTNNYGQCNVEGWQNIVAIDVSNNHTVGLTADGKVVAVGLNDQNQCAVEAFSNAVAIAAGGYHTLVLHADGSVSAIGMTLSGQCNTADWTDIVAISAGDLHSVGLKADGSVVAAGSSGTGRCDVDEWSNVIQISAGESATVGLTADGKLLLASGDTNSGDVSTMTDIIWVCAGSNSVTALRSNGTLVTTGSTPPDLTYVSAHEIFTSVYGVQ